MTHPATSPMSRFCALGTTRWVLVGVVLIFTTTLIGGEDTALAPERWRENAYGVSLRPPVGARLASRTADQAAVRIYSPGNQYTIALYIKKSGRDVSVEELVPQAIHQLGAANPSATILDQQTIKPAGRPGAVIYFRIPDRKREPWVMSQAFMQIDPRTFAMLQLEADESGFAAARAVFEAVIDSLEVDDPRQLDQARAQQIEQGEAWRQAAPRRRDRLRPEQWLRIVQGDRDIGYMCVRQAPAREINHPGVRVDVQSRIQWDKIAYDSISSFFLSDDDETEVWSVRTTARPLARTGPRNPNSPPDTQSWAETGVRGQNKITVTLERPSGREEHRWERPADGYLSQVEIQMIEQLLGDPEKRDLGFYAYYSTAQKIVYRAVRVDPSPDGSYTVHIRPSPEHDGHTSYYSPDGKLIKRELPDGQTIIPATRAELAARWKLQ